MPKLKAGHHKKAKLLIFLEIDQLDYLRRTANLAAAVHKVPITPSAIIRRLIDESIERERNNLKPNR